jgi:hypothetical protein
MGSDNITTTNRQAMLNLIQQADETGEISVLQQQTQHITSHEERTTILINSTDGETFDTNGSIDITGSVNINSSDNITNIVADINVSVGEINLSTSSDDTSESGSMVMSYQSIGFNSANVGNVMDIVITPTELSISGTIDDSALTIINIKELPTSSSGLQPGTIYRDGTALRIVP